MSLPLLPPGAPSLQQLWYQVVKEDTDNQPERPIERSS